MTMDSLTKTKTSQFCRFRSLERKLSVLIILQYLLFLKLPFVRIFTLKLFLAIECFYVSNGKIVIVIMPDDTLNCELYHIEVITNVQHVCWLFFTLIFV